MSHLEHVGETKPGRRREKTAIRKILARSPVRRDKKVIWLLSGGESQSQSPNKKKVTCPQDGHSFIHSVHTLLLTFWGHT